MQLFIYFAIHSLIVPNYDSSCIPFFSDDNYKDRKKKVLTLSCKDFDLTLRVDKPNLQIKVPKMIKLPMNSGSDYAYEVSCGKAFGVQFFIVPKSKII